MYFEGENYALASHCGNFCSRGRARQGSPVTAVPSKNPFPAALLLVRCSALHLAPSSNNGADNDALPLQSPSQLWLIGSENTRFLPAVCAAEWKVTPATRAEEDLSQ